MASHCECISRLKLEIKGYLIESESLGLKFNNCKLCSHISICVVLVRCLNRCLIHAHCSVPDTHYTVRCLTRCLHSVCQTLTLLSDVSHYVYTQYVRPSLCSQMTHYMSTLSMSDSHYVVRCLTRCPHSVCQTITMHNSAT